MDNSNVVIALIVLFVVFMVCREIFCWYWKINRIVAALEKIAANNGHQLDRTISN